MNVKRLLIVVAVIFVAYYVLSSPKAAAGGASELATWSIATVQAVAEALRSFIDGLLQ